MKLAPTLAATAACAAVALPAAAHSGGAKPAPPDAGAVQLVSCLRAHDVGVPAGTYGLALKLWLRDRLDSAELGRAMKACAPAADVRRKAQAAAVARAKVCGDATRSKDHS